MSEALSTIVVGCDLSQGSDGAIDRAIELAEQHRADIVLVHAQADDAPIEHVDNEMLKQIGEVSAAVRVEEARQLADKLTVIQARGLKADVISRIGPPAEILSKAAVERHAQLIIVGTHGRTGISRFLIGSQATEVIRHATCDVLVCRGPSRGPFAKPLVATDFSPASMRAMERTSALCQPGAPLELVHAWQLPAGSWGATLLGQARFPWSTVRDAVLSGAKAQADKLVASTTLPNPLHVELVQGPPAQVITAAAERGGHDLIAVGAHGHRGVRRLLLGSVAESTLRHAPCSVLVVHGPQTA
jgi:nucleotide-binding universal stress UspA family protein